MDDGTTVESSALVGVAVASVRSSLAATWKGTTRWFRSAGCYPACSASRRLPKGKPPTRSTQDEFLTLSPPIGGTNVADYVVGGKRYMSGGPPRQLTAAFADIAKGASMAFVLNYDDAIHLDAEALAEAGIAEAYQRLMPRLRKFAKQPLEVIEKRNDDAPSYSVQCRGKSFAIYAPDIEETSNSWGNATVALFTIVNDQLANSTHRFYAINGGNDLFGIFLTPAQAAEAQKALPNRRDWPYLPKDEQEWYGQFH